MYVTRPLSLYRNDPSALSLPPPDGPNTGILVIQDDNNGCSCFKLFCSSNDITTLPFPQNKTLRATIPRGQFTRTTDVRFIPVINEPLSTSLYYIIKAEGTGLGYAFTCSCAAKDAKCCFCLKFIGEAAPRPLEPSNIYQEFQIKPRRDVHRFMVQPFAADGILPYGLWDSIKVSILNSFQSNEDAFGLDHSPSFQLNDDAFGLDHSLRGNHPPFDFPLSCKTSNAVIVGKWYCPFMFVKENKNGPMYQMRRSMFYEMTLKQQWVNIFACTSDEVKGDTVSVDLNVYTERIEIIGMGTTCQNTYVAHGVKWFRGVDKEGADIYVGLSTAITEKMIRDQQSVGWVRERNNVNRVEQFGGKGEWKKFGCYMLVERYVLRASDDRLLLTYEFRHTHQIRCKWE